MARSSPPKALREPPFDDNNELNLPALRIQAVHFFTCKKLFLSPCSQRERNHLLDVPQLSWGQNSGPFDLENAASVASILECVQVNRSQEETTKERGIPPSLPYYSSLARLRHLGYQNIFKSCDFTGTLEPQLAKSKVHSLWSYTWLYSWCLLTVCSCLICVKNPVSA